MLNNLSIKMEKTSYFPLFKVLELAHRAQRGFGTLSVPSKNPSFEGFFVVCVNHGNYAPRKTGVLPDQMAVQS
jgi:hypothetical protein